MDTDDFADQVRTFRNHSNAKVKRDYRQRSSQYNGSDQNLQEAFEELQIAEEELRQQNEELVNTRQTIEVERQRYRDLFNFAPDGYIVTDQHGTIQEINRAALSLLHIAQRHITGKPLASFVAQRERGNFRKRLAQLGNSGDIVNWETCFRSRSSAEIDVLLRVGIVRDGKGGITTLRWLVHDITERKQAEAKIQQRNQELEVLNTIIGPLSHTLDVRVIMATLKSLMPDRLNIPGGAIFIWDDSEAPVRLQAHWGLAEKALASLTAATSGTMYGGKLNASQATELTTSRRRVVQRLMVDGSANGWSKWQSHECVQLLVDDDVQGFIDLFRHEPDAFSEEQSVFFNILGQQVSVAIQNARLYEEGRAGREQLQMLSRRLVEVQEQERRSIARELHDEIGQALTSLKICLEAGNYLPPKAARARLDEAWTIANQLIGQVRQLSLDLRPAMLDDLGLLAALRWHFRRYTSQTGIHVDFLHDGLERRFSGELETAVYRILQEALTNVARYSGVTRVEVKVFARPAMLSIDVNDQGIGFDPASLKKAASNGLTGMQERAVLLGGRMIVKAAPGKGTELRIELPFAGRGDDRSVK
jgi:PAS domain S-box-containing protein